MITVPYLQEDTGKKESEQPLSGGASGWMSIIAVTKSGLLRINETTEHKQPQKQ
jgi:hypothetical protein